jgi:hypothetical protein
MMAGNKINPAGFYTDGYLFSSILSGYPNHWHKTNNKRE